MAGMVTIKDRAADLGIREMILGVLQSKDKSGKNIIHSSDFRTTITDLGFSMGSSIVENILIYCKLDESGNIDFSNLESQLVRERKLVNSQAKPAKVPASSSVGVSTRPWRADDVHKAKLEAERQILMINENHNEINGLYSALALHEITSRDAIDALEGLGINCTSAFLKTLQRMEFSDVTFSEFVRSLSAYYNEQADLDAQQVAAGGFARKPEDAGEQIGLRRKRATGNARNIVFYESALQDAPERRQRKQITATVGKGYRTYAAHDQRMFKTSAVQEILREDINADDPISGTIPLLSHAQHDMATGKMGKVVSGVDRVKYNIERKLQREQVFAALRKLDAGELTMEDFQDVLFSIGVDLPEALHARLSRAVIAGNIDLRQFIKLMDASLFKAQALEEIVHSPNHLDLVALFRDRLCRGSVGASVYVKLIQVFRIMDSDGDGLLTFQEFSFACKQMEITAGSNGISEDDLRLLFHAFDLQGCGTIDLRTFLHTLTQRVGKPHYTAQRAQTVRHAFELLTRLSGEPVLRVEEMVDAMDLSEHPAIVCSASHATEKECIHDLLQFFEYLSRVRFSSSSTNADEIPPASESLLTAYDTGVNFDAFEAYFQALSAAIDGFDVPVDPFVTAMRKCFGLSAEKQPAPPVFVVKKGSLAAQHNARMAGETTISPLVAAPRALQHHGDCITWRQAEDGVLEVEERRLEQQQGRKIYPQSLTRNFNTDVINWQRRQDNPPSPKESQSEELRAMGISRITGVPKKNRSGATKQLLMWSTRKSPVNPDAQPASIQQPPPPPTLPFQEETPAAGTPALTKSSKPEVKRKLAAKGLEDYYLRPKPFGTDDNNNFVCKDVPGVGSPTKSSFERRSCLSNIYNMNPPPTAKDTVEPTSPSPSTTASVSSLREALQAKSQQPKSLASFIRKQ